jgi:hypothetical protein
MGDGEIDSDESGEEAARNTQQAGFVARNAPRVRKKSAAGKFRRRVRQRTQKQREL